MTVRDNDFINETFSSIENLIYVQDAITGGRETALGARIDEIIDQAAESGEFSNKEILAICLDVAGFARFKAEEIMHDAFDGKLEDDSLDLNLVRQYVTPLMDSASYNRIIKKHLEMEREQDDADGQYEENIANVTPHDSLALTDGDKEIIANVLDDPETRDRVLGDIANKEGMFDVDHALARVSELCLGSLKNESQQLAFLIKVNMISRNLTIRLMCEILEKKNLESVVSEADEAMENSEE